MVTFWFLEDHCMMSDAEAADYLRGLGWDVTWDFVPRAPVRDTSMYDDPYEHLLPPYDPIDVGRYPHACPRCGHPAYVGLSDVDCSRGCG